MSSTDGENQPDNTHLDERCSGITEPFVMQPNPNMDYNVLALKECPRCKEYEPDFKFKNCSFDIEHRGRKVVQIFECTRCKHKWEIEYK